jgi:lysophospholipase L1-like esterase
MTPLRLRVLTSGLALAFALLGAEVVARATYGEGFRMLVDPRVDHTYRPFLDYEQPWAGHTVRFYSNDLGWKASGPGQVVAKRAARPRILLLGDSFAEGLGCPYEETLGHFAERALQAAGWDGEVLNGGRSSYCPLLSLQRLQTFLQDGYTADRLVYLLDVSDLQDVVDYAARSYVRAPDGTPVGLRGWRYAPGILTLYNASALFRSLDHLQSRARGGWHQGGAATAAPRALPAALREDAPPLSTEGFRALPPRAYLSLRANWMGHPPSLQGWARGALDTTFADLLRIRRLAAAHGMPMALVIYPWPQMAYTREDPAYYEELRRYFGSWYEEREMIYGRRPAPRVTAYERKVHDFCRAHQIPLLDLIPGVQAAGRWHEIYQAGDVHFNTRGNRMAGERLARFLREEGLAR